MFALIVMAVVGSFLWRLRGGLLNDLTGRRNYKVLGIPFNDTVVRIIWATGMTSLLWLLDKNYADGSILIIQNLHIYLSVGIISFISIWLSLFYGTTVIGWFGYNIVPTKLHDVVGLSISGTLRMLPLGIITLSPWPIISGILFGPVYWIGGKMPKYKPWMFWGEILCGATIGICLSFLT